MMANNFFYRLSEKRIHSQMIYIFIIFLTLPVMGCRSSKKGSPPAPETKNEVTDCQDGVFSTTRLDEFAADLSPEATSSIESRLKQAAGEKNGAEWQQIRRLESSVSRIPREFQSDFLSLFDRNVSYDLRNQYILALLSTSFKTNSEITDRYNLIKELQKSNYSPNERVSRFLDKNPL
jgi:hypothetical protein